MKVEDYINDILKTRKVHLTLLDPEEQTPEEALQMAQAAIKGGSDGIMLGGSTMDAEELELTAKILKENIEKPIIIFPANASSVTSYADAIFFMSYLNSNNPYWIIGAQALGAAQIKKAGIETIPMGYVVAEPGGTVGWVGEARLLPHNKPKIAAAYALGAEFLGMRYYYIEAGSGADKPIPPEMIGYCKKATDDLKIVVGGGIRTAEDSFKASIAGADIIVTGTIVEESNNIELKIREIIAGMQKAVQAAQQQ